MNDYIFRRLDDELIEKLPSLYKEVYNIEINPSAIRSKFDSSLYTGTKNIAFAALDENEQPVAFLGVFPTVVNFEGQKYLCGQLGDGMTHKLHQRNGLYVKLIELLRELSKKEGIKLLFGFTYGEIGSFKGLVDRQGFIPKRNLHSYVISVKTLPFCRVLNKTIIGAKFYKFFLKNILSWFYPLKQSFSANYQCGDSQVIKDKPFFDYRFSYSDSFIIALSGVGLWMKYSKFGSLMAGDFENYKNFEKTLKSLRRFCFFSGIRAIQIEVSPESEPDVILSKKYSYKENYYVCQLKLENIPLENINFVFGDLDSF